MTTYVVVDRQTWDHLLITQPWAASRARNITMTDIKPEPVPQAPEDEQPEPADEPVNEPAAPEDDPNEPQEDPA